MVKHNGVLYRAADAHAHIYPGKIAEKATENVGRFYDLPMAEVGLPHVLNEEGTAVGFDKFLVCSVATKVEQVGSINRFIAAKCEKYPKFVGLGAWHRDIEDVEKELNEIQALGLHGIKLHSDFKALPSMTKKCCRSTKPAWRAICRFYFTWVTPEASSLRRRSLQMCSKSCRN